MQLQRGVAVSADRLRRWLHQLGWVWKRAKLVARDDDPERVTKLAVIRFCFENLSRRAALLFADELDIHLLPKVGYQWMPKGEVVELVTPGQNQKRYLAGALDTLTGKVMHCIGKRKTALLFVELLQAIEQSYPSATYKEIFLVVGNSHARRIHIPARNSTASSSGASSCCLCQPTARKQTRLSGCFGKYTTNARAITGGERLSKWWKM